MKQETSNKFAEILKAAQEKAGKVKACIKWANGKEMTERVDLGEGSDLNPFNETVGQYLSRHNSVMYSSNIEKGKRSELGFEDAPGAEENQMPELSTVTIDDILNGPVYCAPVSFELPKTRAQIIAEETVNICKDFASENKTVAFEVEKYSEYSFAVFGDTKPIKEDLKRLGGKFNPCLKYGEERRAGWIFALRHLDAVKNFLQL